MEGYCAVSLPSVSIIKEIVSSSSRLDMDHWDTIIWIMPPLKAPDSKFYGVNMGPTWGRQDPGGPHLGPMNLAIWCIAARANFS